MGRQHVSFLQANGVKNAKLKDHLRYHGESKEEIDPAQAALKFAAGIGRPIDTRKPHGKP